MTAPAVLRQTLLASLVLGACQDDQCRAGQSECASGVARNCVLQSDSELSSHLVWSTEACGARQCVVAAGGARPWAVCALGAGPDPLCPAVPRSEKVLRCAPGQVRIACLAGYRTATDGCEQGNTCLEVLDPGTGCTTGARCSLLAAPDPLCARTVYSTCDGSTRIACDCGIRTGATACRSCVTRVTPVEGAAGATFTTAECRQSP